MIKCIFLPWVGGAPLIGNVLSSAGQDGGQGQLGNVGLLATVLDVGQPGEDGPQPHVAVVMVTQLPSLLLPGHLHHQGDGHHPPHTLPGHTHVGVEVTVVAIDLDLCWEAVVVDGVF